jgi:hypothetical protein
MNFGYLIIISESEKYDYLKMAYALAMSIKNTQKPGYDKVALVTDDVEKVSSLNSPWVFDHVIFWNQKTYWDGRAWMDELTPFDETVCLDADMLFFRDYSHWIDSLRSNFEIFLPSKSYTYRDEIVIDKVYRKAFIKNNLPNLYSFFTFFKSNAESKSDFFELGRRITTYPTEFTNMFLDQHKPSIMGTDEAFSLSSKILGIDDNITADIDYPKVVHLKPEIQNWPWSANAVTDYVGFYLGINGSLKIGNFQQQNIVHYVEKELMTDEVVSLLEGVLWKKL